MTIYVLALISLTLALHTSARSYPGTKTRPILSDEEASRYTINNYFSGWEPEEIVIPDNPDFIVKAGQSIQEVVNEAIIKNEGSLNRTYIKIEPGHYMETVYIKGNVLLTIYGNPESPEDVHIMSTLSSQTSVSDYQQLVNPNGTRYKEGDPAWEFYKKCASKSATGSCSAVFWVGSPNFQLEGVTIHNGATDAQGLAIKTAADKIHLMNNRFLGFQDTVGLTVERNQNQVQRVLVHMCYIEGQIDYVYGNAAAVFKMTTFNTVAINKTKSAVIFAPGTDPSRSYGFLVINSTITGDASYIGSNKGHLARSWDQGIKKAELYVPGKSPNGQLVIRDSHIDNVINVTAPYYAAATSARPFTSDIRPSRDLDDNTHNKMWEYNNSGDGA